MTSASVRAWVRRIGFGGAVALMAPSGLVIHAAVASAHTSGRTAACTATSPDTDRDHIADCWEGPNGLTVGLRDGKKDRDHDGLTAVKEFSLDVRTTGN